MRNKYRCSTSRCSKEPAVRLPSGEWKCQDCWEKLCDKQEQEWKKNNGVTESEICNG